MLDIGTVIEFALPRIEFAREVHDDVADLALFRIRDALCSKAVPDELRRKRLVRHGDEVRA